MKLIKIKEILISADKIICIYGTKNKLDFILVGNEEVVVTTKDFSVENLLSLMATTEGDVVDISNVVETIQ